MALLTPYRELSDDDKRRVLAEAQARRISRARLARRRGKCFACGWRPRRPNEKNCLKCHAESMKKYREPARLAGKAQREAEAKVRAAAAKLERARRLEFEALRAAEEKLERARARERRREIRAMNPAYALELLP